MRRSFPFSVPRCTNLLLLWAMTVHSWTRRAITRSPIAVQPSKNDNYPQPRKTARQYGNDDDSTFFSSSWHPEKLSALSDPATSTLSPSVYELIQYRLSTQSRPGARQDPYRLALSIEGGGMRGAVSAGMASALADRGILEAVDCIYGSSAGAMIGAYVVSRQTDCCHVYSDILPAAKRKFVCKGRMLDGLGRMAADWLLGSKFADTMQPAINLTMLLDDIVMSGESSLDMDTFAKNDQHQPLRVVVSCVDSNDEHGAIVSKSFGTPEFQSVQRGNRTGLFACLEASMAVPAATGPLVPMQANGTTYHAFDAFVSEPIPYRSAVDEGATHVLALCTRPEKINKRETGLYEHLVAPLFFHRTLPPVADYLFRGDALAIYEEDTEIVLQQKSYRGAAIWGLAVPPWEPELGTTNLKRAEILEALRAGRESVQQVFGMAVGRSRNMTLVGV